jgi:hypothetical protein
MLYLNLHFVNFGGFCIPLQGHDRLILLFDLEVQLLNYLLEANDHREVLDRNAVLVDEFFYFCRFYHSLPVNYLN